MSLDFAAPFRDALAACRRDRDVLLPLAGATMFLPSYALMLLVPEVPRAQPGGSDLAATRAWADAFTIWAGQYGWWYVAAQLASMWGALTVIALYLDRQRPTLGGAALRGLGLLFRYVVAMLLVTFPLSWVALLMFVSPILLPLVVATACYVLGRMMLIGPAIIGEAPLGAAGAVVRSWRLTRGHGWMLAAVYAAIMLLAPLLGSMFIAIGGIAGAGSAANPVVTGIVDALAATVTAAAALLLALVEVSLYRRLASKGT